MFSQKLIPWEMMRPTDFAKYLSAFLTKYLNGERNVSPNTILAYKDTFVQFITFMKEKKVFT